MRVYVVLYAQRILIRHLEPVSHLLANLERSDERFHFGLNTKAIYTVLCLYE